MLLRDLAPGGLREMREATLADYLALVGEIVDRLGGHVSRWEIREVGVSDLSRVMIAEGPDGSVCVKQALPFGQIAGEVMPLPLDRMAFEETALNIYARFVPKLVPRVLHYDSVQGLLVMEHLKGHALLSQIVRAGGTCEVFAQAASRFLAETLFRTSDLGMAGIEKRERMAYFGAKAELIKVIEDLTFVEPYTENPKNRWTSPQLDELVQELRADADLRHAVALLGLKFLNEPQALIHAGLDLQAFLVAGDDVRVIDPKLAIFGPIGFDVGKLIGHLLIAFFASSGLDHPQGSREATERWLLEAIEQLWRGFQERFLGLWRAHHEGDAFPPVLFASPGGQEALELAQQEFLRGVFVDSLRFASATIIRHVIGHIHTPEFDAVEDVAARAHGERHVLMLARELLKDAHHVDSIDQVTAVAKELRDS